MSTLTYTHKPHIPTVYNITIRRWQDTRWPLDLGRSVCRWTKSIRLEFQFRSHNIIYRVPTYWRPGTPPSHYVNCLIYTNCVCIVLSSTQLLLRSVFGSCVTHPRSEIVAPSYYILLLLIMPSQLLDIIMHFAVVDLCEYAALHEYGFQWPIFLDRNFGTPREIITENNMKRRFPTIFVFRRI